MSRSRGSAEALYRGLREFRLKPRAFSGAIEQSLQYHSDLQMPAACLTELTDDQIWISSRGKTLSFTPTRNYNCHNSALLSQEQTVAASSGLPFAAEVKAEHSKISIPTVERLYDDSLIWLIKTLSLLSSRLGMRSCKRFCLACFSWHRLHIWRMIKSSISYAKGRELWNSRMHGLQQVRRLHSPSGVPGLPERWQRTGRSCLLPGGLLSAALAFA